MNTAANPVKKNCKKQYILPSEATTDTCIKREYTSGIAAIGGITKSMNMKPMKAW
jgi:hypothetical protein